MGTPVQLEQEFLVHGPTLDLHMWLVLEYGMVGTVRQTRVNYGSLSEFFDS